MIKIQEYYGVKVEEEFYLKRSYEKSYTKEKYHFNSKGYLIKESGFRSCISPSRITQGYLVIVKIPKENLND